MPTYLVSRNRSTRGNSSFLPSLNANWRLFSGSGQESTWHDHDDSDPEAIRAMTARHRQAFVISDSGSPQDPLNDIDTNASTRPSVSTSASTTRAGRSQSLSVPLALSHVPKPFVPGSGPEVASPREIANSFIASQHLATSMASERAPDAVSEAVANAAKRDLESLGVRRRSGQDRGREKENVGPGPDVYLDEIVDGRGRERKTSHSSSLSRSCSNPNAKAGSRNVPEIRVSSHNSFKKETSHGRERLKSLPPTPRSSMEMQSMMMAMGTGPSPSTTPTSSYSTTTSPLSRSDPRATATTTRTRNHTRSGSMSSISGLVTPTFAGAGLHPPEVKTRTRTLSSARAHTGPPISPSGFIGNSRPRVSTPSPTMQSQTPFQVQDRMGGGGGGRQRSGTTSTAYSTNSMLTYQSNAALLRRPSEGYSPSPSRMMRSSSDNDGAEPSKYLGVDTNTSDAYSRYSRSSNSHTLVASTLERQSSEASQDTSTVGLDSSTTPANKPPKVYVAKFTPRNPIVTSPVTRRNSLPGYLRPLTAQARSPPKLSSRDHAQRSTKAADAKGKSKYKAATARKPLRRRFVLVWKKVTGATRGVAKAVSKARKRMGMGRRTSKRSSPRSMRIREHARDGDGEDSNARSRARSISRSRAHASSRAHSGAPSFAVTNVGSTTSSVPSGFEIVHPNPERRRSRGLRKSWGLRLGIGLGGRDGDGGGGGRLLSEEEGERFGLAMRGPTLGGHF